MPMWKGKKPWKIRGDLHLHSSTGYCGEYPIVAVKDLEGLCGCLPFKEVTRVARDKFEMEYLAITNHVFDPAVAHPNLAEARKKVFNEIKEIRQINEAGNLGIKLLAGVEANILPGGKLDVGRQALERLDIVVAARHFFPKGQTAKGLKNDFLKVLKNPFVDILGHPNRWVKGLSLKNWNDIFKSAKKYKVAIEINVRTPLSGNLLELALEHKVKFSLGSDTHELGGKFPKTALGSDYKDMRNLVDSLIKKGLQEEQVLNTYSLSKLQKWLRVN